MFRGFINFEPFLTVSKIQNRRNIFGPFTFPAFCFESCTALALNHFCHLTFSAYARLAYAIINFWLWKVTFWFQYSFMVIWLWFQFINQGSSDGPTRPDRFIYFLLSSSFLWFSQPKLIKSFLDYSGLSAGPKLLCLTKLNTFWKVRFLWNNNNRKSILI